MLSVLTLQKVSGGLKSTLAAMHKIIDAVNGKIEKFESDTSRSQSFKAENIKTARDESMPVLLKDLASMRERVATVEPHREFWSSRALLLSRIPFDSDPATDAAIRLRYAGELAAMDGPLLALTQKNALIDGNLALVWACAMAGRVSGAELADLGAVDVPGQTEALALIDGCDASLAEAEMVVAGASGLSMSPSQKLTFARRMQPGRAESHNSPGRPSA